MEHFFMKGACLARRQETDAFRMLSFRKSRVYVTIQSEKGGQSWER